MKGIVHFITGVALGTFFPDAVQQAAAGSLVLVLGGIGGILPDALDFRFARLVEEPDVLIDPHPDTFDPQAIANEIAATIDRAATTKRRQLLKLNTMRLGPDWWQQYAVQFDRAQGMVVVKLGPVVNTSQVPLPESGRDLPAGQARVNAPILPTYMEANTIDIFGGPSFLFEWRSDRVEIDFIPWHRQYSHSLLMALAFGALCALLFGPLAGIIGGLGVLGHVLEDQLGYLGSNLLYPLTRTRSAGLGLIHAADAIPNFFTVWTMVWLILFNLDRFSHEPAIDPLMFWGPGWAPALLLLAYYFYRKFNSEKRDKPPLSGVREAEVMAESRESVDI